MEMFFGTTIGEVVAYVIMLILFGILGAGCLFFILFALRALIRFLKS